MITRPFNFEAHLRRPTAGFEVVPYIDACLVAVFFLLLGSKYVVGPGETVELPTAPTGASEAIATTNVITVRENDGREMLIFDGRLHDLKTVGAAMAARTLEAPDEVLLVRADRDVSTQILVRVCELARAAGYKRVHFAVEPERPTGTTFR